MTRRRLRAPFLVLALALLPIPNPADAGPIPATTPAAGYRLLQEISLPGEGGWDYLAVDAAARRLYVTHSTRVAVLDADSGKSIGEIADLAGVHGVAWASELSRGFISNGKTSTVTIFDLKTLQKLGEVATTGENPDAILYDPKSALVFAFNHSGGNATVIAAASGKVVGTIELGGSPEFATSDLAGRIFVNIEDRSEVLAIDSSSLKVLAHWPLAPCEEPSGMAIDRAGHRLLVGCSNKLAAVMDFDSGKVVTSVPIGEGVDANAFDPGTRTGFSSNGSGTLTVIGEDAPDRFRVLEEVATRRGARTMTLDEKTHRVFLATSQFGPPPEPTPDHPHPRPPMIPGTFVVLVFGR